MAFPLGQEEYEDRCDEWQCQWCFRIGIIPLCRVTWTEECDAYCGRCFLSQHAATASRAELKMAAEYAQDQSTEGSSVGDDEDGNEDSDDSSTGLGPASAMEAVLAVTGVGDLSAEQVRIAAETRAPCPGSSYEGAYDDLQCFDEDYTTFVAFRRAVVASLDFQGEADEAAEMSSFTFEETNAYKSYGYCGAGYAYHASKDTRLMSKRARVA